MKSKKTSYHHGNLRETLLAATNEMIREGGLENISLRNLADRVGVSRTAPYHHFKDKSGLLCAIAEKGFCQHLHQAQKIFEDDSKSLSERFRNYVYNYVAFANANPELYELMFGRSIWKQKKSTKQLRAAAYPCFQQQVTMIQTWQKMGLLRCKEDPLRMSQVIWGTLHGIAKLMIDGIYINTNQIEEICDCAINVFIQGLYDLDN